MRLFDCFKYHHRHLLHDISLANKWGNKTSPSFLYSIGRRFENLAPWAQDRIADISEHGSSHCTPFHRR